MSYFDRYDIAEAHYVFASLYHSGGDTRRRDFHRLNRIQFRPRPNLERATLNLNALAIYGQLAKQELEAQRREDAILAAKRR